MADRPLGLDFLAHDYPEVEQSRLLSLAERAVSRLEEGTELRREFTSALRAVTFWYQAFVDAGESFSSSVQRHGDAPGHPHRYYQERDFFMFVVAGLAALEALHYGLFALGAVLQPAAFSFESEDDRRDVTPRSTLLAYERTYSSTPITRALQALHEGQIYRDWKGIRNVLAHRGIPGRIIVAQIGSTSSVSSRYSPFGATRGPDVSPETFPSARGWLARTIRSLLQGASDTVSSEGE